MTMTVAVNWNVIKENWSQDGDLMLQAHGWGREDALEGNDMRGSAYFTIGSPAWESYNEGYGAGLVEREKLAGASDELAFLNDALDSMRANKSACPKCGVWIDKHGRCGCNTRRADPLSSGERIGEHFCTRPFLY